MKKELENNTSVDILENEDFKISIIDIGALQLNQIEKGFAFIIKQNTLEISIEPNIIRKKIICKVFDSNKITEAFEFTPKQLKNVLLSNKAKKAIQSEEEKINEQATKYTNRKAGIADGNSITSVTKRRRKIKDKSSINSTKTKQLHRKGSNKQ